MRLKIQTKLLLIMLILSLMIVVILGAFSYDKSASTVKETLIETTENLENQITLYVEQYFDTYERSLKNLANDSHNDIMYEDEIVLNGIENEHERADFYRTLDNYVSNYPDILHVFYATDDNRIYVYPDDGVPLNFVATRKSWYKDAIEAEDVIWSKPKHDFNVGKKTISASAPIISYKNGSILGVMKIDLDLQNVVDIINKGEFGESGYIFLLDNEGHTIVHRNEELLNEVTPIEGLKELIDSGKSSGTFYFTEEDEDGIKRDKMGMFKKVDGTDFIIASSINESEFEEKSKPILDLTIILGLAALVISTIASFIFIRPISKNIRQLQSKVRIMSKGDLNVKVNIKSRDEIGDLASDFNKMTTTIKSLINNTKNVTDNLLNASKKLSQSSEQATLLSEQVSETMEHISIGASEQTKDTERGATLVTKLSDKFSELMSNSQVMTEKTQDVLEANESGVEVVSELKNTSQNSLVTAKQIEDAIVILNKKATNIGKIVDTIRNIADETNLLSLNASIEAARAGEYGRGFSVVADEIHKLAENASLATGEIHKIIKDMQVESQNTVSIMKDLKTANNEQNEAVHEAENSFVSIQNSIKDIINNIEQINTFIKHIDDDKKEIVTSIEHISSISQETAAATEQVTSNMFQQTEGVQGVSKESKKLFDIAKSLEKEIDQFKI
ncbi:MAG: methyl-accepting chemotaxis protein [Eubacteriales bacterium]